MRHVLWLVLAWLATACGGPELADRMAAEHAGDAPVAGAAALAPAREIASSEVTYGTLDGTPLRGFAAWPADAARPRAGLVVIHEWWGLNEHMRAMTGRLAGEGYLALAVDLYGGQVATDRDEAYRLMQESMRATGAHEDNLRQAMSWLREQRGVERAGTIGWCFGGGWSLNAALMMPERVDAAVIYYGRLETDPERLRLLTMPVLGIFAGQDRAITVDTVRAFEQAMGELGLDLEVHVYDEADHAFANPSGTHYDEKAAADAWRATVAFLSRHLRPAA